LLVLRKLLLLSFQLIFTISVVSTALILLFNNTVVLLIRYLCCSTVSQSWPQESSLKRTFQICLRNLLLFSNDTSATSTKSCNIQCYALLTSPGSCNYSCFVLLLWKYKNNSLSVVGCRRILHLNIVIVPCVLLVYV
jgi:hypothetical protein